jgi:hypothetical protein
MKKGTVFPIVIFCLGWSLASCVIIETTVGSATYTIPRTAISITAQTAVETPTPSQTTTRTQTPTETPAFTQTPTPTATLFPGMQATGPFFVFDNENQSNRSLTFIDFSSTTRWNVDLPESKNDYDRYDGEFSPDWRWYAYVEGSLSKTGKYPEEGITLRLLNLMTGEIQDVASIIPPDYYARHKRLFAQIEPSSIPEDCPTNLIRWMDYDVFILNAGVRSLAWSTDGKYLAFGAMIDGDTSDVYVFDVDTGTIRRVEKGPGNVRNYHWSPDSQWIVFEQIPFDQIPGYLCDSSPRREERYPLWAVKIDGTGTKKIPGPWSLYFWFSDHEYIALYWSEECCYGWDLTLVNILTGYSFKVFEKEIWEVDVDRRTRLMAVSVLGEEGLYFGKVYTQLKLIKSDSGRMAISRLITRGGSIHPFWVWDGYQWNGITSDGKFDNLNIPIGASVLWISSNYWVAAASKKEIIVYDSSDKQRYNLKVLTPFKYLTWDMNSQGIFYIAVVDAIDTIYHWKISEANPRLIVQALPTVDTPRDLFIAPIFNIKTLPNLRVLPTRAEKPAEGASIWSRTQYKELFQPGTNRYEVTIPANSSWRWSFSLGTTDPNLFEKILLPEDVEFRINGEWIDTNMFRMTDRTTEFRFTRAWAAMLSGWRSGNRAELEIKYTLREAVRDGNVEYPAGEYRQSISVRVE